MSRDDLILRHLSLARHLARRFRGRGEPLDDLVQVASIGLIKAAGRWDPERGVAFATFAVPTILGELRRHFRDHTWDIRPSRPVQELWLAAERAREPLAREIGREPTLDELAARLGRDPVDVAEALRVVKIRRLPSLDDELAARTAARDDEIDGVEARVDYERLLASLDAPARDIVRLRFERDLVQAEIGARVGLSQVSVSRSLRASLDALAAVAA